MNILISVYSQKYIINNQSAASRKMLKFAQLLYVIKKFTVLCQVVYTMIKNVTSFFMYTYCIVRTFNTKINLQMKKSLKAHFLKFWREITQAYHLRQHKMLKVKNLKVTKMKENLKQLINDLYVKSQAGAL